MERELATYPVQSGTDVQVPGTPTTDDVVQELQRTSSRPAVLRCAR